MKLLKIANGALCIMLFLGGFLAHSSSYLNLLVYPDLIINYLSDAEYTVC
ncbi:MAG: hypothetical protein MUD12_02870 [Spirochaetes bacterium]|jgi:hypothetical protein|nr:hypothetical protein [Spirochaetota bacterium]